MPSLAQQPNPAIQSKPSFPYESIVPFFLTIILFLAFALRAAGSQWGLPGGEHLVSSYRPDEYSLFAWLRRMNPGSLDFNPNIYFNGTFLLFVLAAFYKLLAAAGILAVSSSPVFYYQHPEELGKIFWFGRMFMVILGTASVAVLYRAGSAAFGKRAGLAAAFLLAIAPMHVITSKHMLIEPAAVLWFSLASFFCLKIISKPQMRDYIFAGLVIGNACAVKVNCAPWGLLLILAHFFSARKETKHLLTGLGISAAAYFVSNPFLLFNLPEAFAELSTWGEQYTKAWQGLGYGPLFSVTHLLPAGMGRPLLIWSAAALAWGIFSKEKTVRFLVCAALLVFYLHARTGTVIAKYHVLLLPFFCLLSGAFLDYLLRSFSGFVRVAVLTAFTLVALQTISLSVSYNRLFSSKDPRDRASEWIQENIPAGTALAVYKQPYDHSPPVIYNQFYFTGKSSHWQVERRYPIVLLNEDVSKLAGSQAAYAVFTLPENRSYRLSAGSFSKEDSWVPLEQALAAQGYKIIQVFTAEAGKLIDRRFPPADWLQLLPEIRIYVKVGGVS